MMSILVNGAGQFECFFKYALTEDFTRDLVKNGPEEKMFIA